MFKRSHITFLGDPLQPCVSLRVICLWWFTLGRSPLDVHLGLLSAHGPSGLEVTINNGNVDDGVFPFFAICDSALQPFCAADLFFTLSRLTFFFFLFFFFLGSSLNRWRGPIEWEDFPSVRTSVGTSVCSLLWAIQPGLKPVAWLAIWPQTWLVGPQAWLARSQAWLAGTDRLTDIRTGGRKNGWTSPILAAV